MNMKQQFFYTVSSFLLILCFILSMQSVSKSEGGFSFTLHASIALYGVIGILFSNYSLKQIKFKPASKFAAGLIWFGMFLGTTGMLNIVFVNPVENKGLFFPWLFTLVIIILFRNLFFPLHLHGFRFVKNIAIAAGILLCFKILVYTALLLKIGGFIPPLLLKFSGISSFLSISEEFKGYYAMEVMSMIWFAGIACYYCAFALISSTVKEENEDNLKLIKNNFGLSTNHMELLNLSNKELLAMTELEVEDVVLKKSKNIADFHKKHNRLKKIIEQDNNNLRWISNIRGLIE